LSQGLLFRDRIGASTSLPARQGSDVARGSLLSMVFGCDGERLISRAPLFQRVSLWRA
jgi:hypothetical protein